MDCIEIDKLVPFEGHMFSLYKDSRLDELVKSIKDLGVINPVIVRPKGFDGTMEILSGHNRVNAAQLAGLKEIPYVINNPDTDEEALRIVFESNYNQQDFTNRKISEKAIAIAKWQESLIKQGSRKDITDEIKRLQKDEEMQSDFPPSNPDEQKADNSSCPVGNEEFFSARNIARYLRLAILTDGMLDRIDYEEISIRAGVELSYLDKRNLDLLDTILGGNDSLKCTEKIARELRNSFSKGKLKNEDDIIAILKGETCDKRKEKKVSVVLRDKFLFQYFDKSQDKKEITSQVEKSLNFTQNVIPQLLRDNNVKAVDYENVVSDALEFFFKNSER